MNEKMKPIWMKKSKNEINKSQKIPSFFLITNLTYFRFGLVLNPNYPNHNPNLGLRGL
jgi:hypothetical protein